MKDDNPEYNEYITTLVAWMKVCAHTPFFECSYTAKIACVMLFHCTYTLG